MKRANLRSRIGLTLIEILVCAALVSLLLALALPALGGAMEAQRRSQCQTNLRQLGLALSQYHDVNGRLPPGRYPAADFRVAPRTPCDTIMTHKSFLFELLPFLGQQSLYDSFNQELFVYGFENSSVHARRTGGFACPSDSGAVVREANPDAAYPIGPLARGPSPMFYSSYVGNFGTLLTRAMPGGFADCRVPSRVRAQQDGLLNDRHRISFADIHDGLSKTMLVTERETGSFKALDQFRDNASGQFGWWLSGNLGGTLVTATCPPNPQRRYQPFFLSAWTYSASSAHAGGVNVLMADGAVTFVADTIDSWAVDPTIPGPRGATFNSDTSWSGVPAGGIWQAMATRHGSESGY